ncbi:MAG TPA: dephospho-CoA kinase [Acidobacteriaceae bacterium]|jgi:dephospho-CoA kinase|nr:dephospho-CoA kinase [Acidobacteriaceae bacterium]
MLRVGLTGELGSGKSTLAHMLAERGAVVLSSDEMARAMMQPGDPVYTQIVALFGSGVVQPDGSLDRKALAHLAFDPRHPRAEELNAIVHPAVIAEQAKQIANLAKTQPHAIVVVESALIFSTRYAPGGAWHKRFDCIVLVTAPDEVKVERFVRRMAQGRELSPGELLALRADAQRRLLVQRIPMPESANVLEVQNSGDMDALREQAQSLWKRLTVLEQARPQA